MLQVQLARFRLIESDKHGATRLASKVDGVPAVTKLQNQFCKTKFYAKKQKTKNAVLDTKKTFSYKTYEKNFVLLKKFAL